MLGSWVLGARTTAGIDHEVYALPITYQLVQASGIISETVIDLVGTIGRRVLAEPLPDRRLRVCPRLVKRAISKYQARGPNIDRTCRTARIDIDILTGARP